MSNITKGSELSDMNTNNATEQDISFASQWQLMWMRFRRHKLALVGGIILLVLYTIAGFCEFISPYLPDQRNADYVLTLSLIHI